MSLHDVERRTCERSFALACHCVGRLCQHKEGKETTQGWKRECSCAYDEPVPNVPEHLQGALSASSTRIPMLFA